MFYASDADSAVVELGGGGLACLFATTSNSRRIRENLRSAVTDLIVAPTANMVPFDVVAATIVPARVYENQVYVAYANYCGHEGEIEYCGLSCVAAPDGSNAARLGGDEELIICALDHGLLTASRQTATYLADRRPQLDAGLSTPTPEFDE